MERLRALFRSCCGHDAAAVTPITGSGSNRRYFRLTGIDGHTLIGVIGTSKEENHAFIYLAQHFWHQQLPVPHVLAMTADGLCYLQNDLGSRSLFDALQAGREAGGCYSEAEVKLLRRTIALLPARQYKGAEGLDFNQCYPLATMDRQSILFDLNYFKYCFLKATGLDFHEVRLEEDFQRMAEDLLAHPSDTFLYRDLQSRNVMLVDGKPFFIDFQGGRRGPVYYDVASFLWQSSARIAPSDRQQLIDVYLDSLRTFRPVDRQAFIHNLQAFVLFRTLQVLGAYGYRGLWEKKDYFIKSIPFALDNLSDQLAAGACDAYPYLKHVCQRLVDINEANKRQQAEEKRKRDRVEEYLSNDVTYCNATPTRPLVVRVYSFAFKKGIPADNTGNGGGYVFDCRSTHNPGRYEEYKPLTGLDQPVIDFLESDGEILTFLQSVYKLVDFHVERFISRGFTDMQINFGCTGGKHRSVYCAQHTAQHLNEKYGIEVHIIHRERNITSVLEAKK